MTHIATRLIGLGLATAWVLLSNSDGFAQAAGGRPDPYPAYEAWRQSVSLHIAGRIAAAEPEVARAYKKLGVDGRTLSVRVRIEMTGSGRIVSTEVAQSSGEPVIDALALRAVRQASPLPRYPYGVPTNTHKLSLPINFKVNSGSRLTVTTPAGRI